MPKIQGYIYRGLLIAICIGANYFFAAGQHRLIVVPVDKDSAFLFNKLNISKSFTSQNACLSYIDKLLGTLHVKGYAAASIDSVYSDSISTTIHLFSGEVYQLAGVKLQQADKKSLEQSGWNEKLYLNKPLNIIQLGQLREKMLDYFENHGYPFASIGLDSILIEGEKFTGVLKVDKGPLYKIDSIRLNGEARISNIFLQRYLDLYNGNIYRKTTLQNISKKIRELPYLEEQQPWGITMLGTGSVVNLYLKPKKASQVDVLVGFLPANEQLENNALLLTGEANINLKNALGNGESIGLNWQQIQVKSPRLNLSFQQPFLFGSLFGINAAFDLFKKDSSFININLLLGLQYTLSVTKTGRVFLQNIKTNLLTVDTAAVKASRTLPDVIDVRSVNLGVNYLFSKTDYANNPRKGNEWHIVASAGVRNIKKNNTIIRLTAPDFNFSKLYDTVKLQTYQFRILLFGAHYFPINRQSTIKTAATVGWIQSPSIYRNELFQIGGYKLLRGFDEESINATRYVVTSVEYHYLLGLNSFLFAFLDGGWAANKSIYANTSNIFLGTGIGMAFETKAGVFNISYAVGKRDDTPFSIRQSKIHLGYINFF